LFAPFDRWPRPRSKQAHDQEHDGIKPSLEGASSHHERKRRYPLVQSRRENPFDYRIVLRPDLGGIAPVEIVVVNDGSLAALEPIVTLGIPGEYIGRLFEGVKHRRVWLVKGRINLARDADDSSITPYQAGGRE
jgi:hypothetical protein